MIELLNTLNTLGVFPSLVLIVLLVCAAYVLRTLIKRIW